jgi:hypothetical protein
VLRPEPQSVGGQVCHSSIPLPRLMMIGAPIDKRRSISRLAASCILAAMSPKTGEIREECCVAATSSSSVKGCRFQVVSSTHNYRTAGGTRPKWPA